VPYCDQCDKWRAPNALLADGTCPRCGTKVAEPEPASDAPAQAATKIPWHFWVMVIAAAIYLGWRAVQGLMWLF
jgi:hypothetical protein